MRDIYVHTHNQPLASLPHGRKDQIPLREEERSNLEEPPRLPPPAVGVERLHERELDLMAF